MIRSKNAPSVIVTLAPNPVRDYASLKIETEHAYAGTVRIVNSLGMLVSVKNINLSKGENKIVLSNTFALKSGTYQVVVNAGNNSSTVKMLISR
jgi:hypothetical protein